MNKYQEVKKELKVLAKQIKTYRLECKEMQRQIEFDLIWRLDRKFRKAVYRFRHKHIAVSIIRGRNRDEIEKPADDNLPNECYIEELVNKYEQTLCISA